MIDTKNLCAVIEGKTILNNLSMTFEPGKNYCILGKNGSGKSSFASVLMGHPKYEVTGGEMNIGGQDLLKMSPEERSHSGIFLSFQNIPEIKGIQLDEYLRTIYNINLKINYPITRPLSPFLFQRFLQPFLTKLKIDKSFLCRDLNVGFSGGEKRKIETLQMLLIEPKYIILDEIDSGLDSNALKLIMKVINEYSKKKVTFIVITHNFKILNAIEIDTVYVFEDGSIKEKGTKKLAESIEKNGY